MAFSFILETLGIPLWLAISLLVIALLYHLGTRNHGYLKGMGLKHPPPRPFFGNLLYLATEGFSGDDTLVKKYGKIFGYYEGRTPVVVICDADVVRDVTVKDFDHFVNRRTSGFPINKEMKGALSVAKDDEWKGIRNVITPTFSGSKMKRMTHMIVSSAKDMVENMKKHVGEENTEVKYICGCFTMDVIATTMFGTKVKSQIEENSEFVRHARKAFDMFSLKDPIVLLVFLFPSIVPWLEKVGYGFMAKDTVQFFRDNIYSILDMRQTMKNKPVDFLQLMLEAHDTELDAQDDKISAQDDTHDVSEQIKDWRVGKRALSQREILGNALIFFLAGYETTASAMSWMLHLLAIHPDVQEKLFHEVEVVMDSCKGDLTYDAVATMQYMDQVFCETLRLYPPAQRSDRVCKVPCTIEGYKIPKDQVINIGIWAIHHSEEYWPQPYKFDPDRFSPENKGNIVPYSWTPFGSGPRNCVGMRFATLEAKIAMAYILKHFRLSISSKTEMEPKLKAQGFSAPKNGINIHVEER